MRKFLIACLVLVILFGGYIGLAFVLHRIDKGPFSSPGNSAQQAQSAHGTGSVDQSLVGNWDTGCLVPDPNSPWAERHTFTIKSDGTVDHKRYSGDSCAALKADQDDNAILSFPGGDKVNLAYTSGNGAGATVYDIYQVSGNTLKFGHGFCNCVSTTGKFGVSESDRFTSLNNFLLYKKQ